MTETYKNRHFDYDGNLMYWAVL